MTAELLGMTAAFLLMTAAWLTEKWSANRYRDAYLLLAAKELMLDGRWGTP